jgi:hypothetical protein
MDANEFKAWVERYVRQEVEKQLEDANECEQTGNMAEWFASGTAETTDADGFTASDRAFLADMKISVEVAQ